MASAPKSPTPAVAAKKPAVIARPSKLRTPKQREAKAEIIPSLEAPRAYFLIGENKKIAGDVAEHEWGWKPTKTGWDGPVKGIRFLADYADVKNETDKGGTIAVFEGYRWYATIAPHLLDALVKTGAVVKIPAPQTA